MNFNDSFVVLLGNEGKYTNDPKDRGNWTSGKIGVGALKGTKYGISAMTYPKIDIKNLTIDSAKEIYKRDFWDILDLDNLPEDIRFDIFDMSVNSGSFVAARTLQLAIGTKPDGNIGSKSILAAKNCNNLRLKFNAYRLLYYTSLPSFDTYGEGWIRRVAKNLLL